MGKIINNPKDHDFIRTTENYLFCVIGYSHPPNRVISYLKYIPSPNGKWKLYIPSINKKRNQETIILLKRVIEHYSAAEVLRSHKLLVKNYQKYLFTDPISKIQLIAVPHDSITTFYRPQDKIKSLFARSKKRKVDALQQKVLNFINYLSNLSGIEASNYGITGSILTNTHNVSFSDIDLTIHGRSNSQVIEDIIKGLFEENSKEVTRLKPKEAENWQKNKIKIFNFNKEQAKILFERKWNMGFYKNTRFSIHPIRKENEIVEKYGDLEFFPKEIVEIEGKITSDEDSIFLPCKYGVSNVVFLKKERAYNIEQICSYEGLYCFMVNKGESFRAKGKLEEVLDKKRNKTYHRLVIGSYLAESRDYLLPIIN